ncbi:MAG: sulfoxide reductase heme-binding subunit YedZ [Thiomonas sp. 13-66-29]|nr:MAG: sulfoxide reductase heme-binding subunit YedZ [Thiomonas sp. 15-66-11]OZB62534.1 MAG: sulfoxide reductase heme-binding subunit YedZ [Thiomonas sp. 13-66-29]
MNRLDTPTAPTAGPGLRLRRATLQARWFKPLLFMLGLLPLASLVWRALTVQLGANPEQTLIWTTGLWALRFLLLTLAITPLRKLTGWAELARLRRMLGLFAFTYALLHFTCYLWLVNGFGVDAVLKDVVKHPFVLAGMTALVLMLPLAATSTNGMIKRLGAVRWQALHRLVYAVAIIAVFHYWWGKLAKNNTVDPKIYATMLGVLLAYRVAKVWQTRRRNVGPRRAAARI